MWLNDYYQLLDDWISHFIMYSEKTPKPISAYRLHFGTRQTLICLHKTEVDTDFGRFQLYFSRGFNFYFCKIKRVLQ